jgi:chromosome segregation ATPase
MSKLTSMEGSMNTKFDQVRDDLSQMKSEFSNLQKEVQTWKDRVEVLEKEKDELKQSNDELLERVKRVEKVADDLEGRSRRNNRPGAQRGQPS